MGQTVRNSACVYVYKKIRPGDAHVIDLGHEIAPGVGDLGEVCAKTWADLFTTLPVAERGPRGPSLLYGIVSGGEYAYSKTSAERSAPGL